MSAPTPEECKAHRPRHAGILVVHGMGNESSYGPLDSFARGLYRHYHDPAGQPQYALKTEWRQRAADPSHIQATWTQAQIRFERLPEAAGNLPESITVAEYYWSPATKGRIKDIAVLTWLLRTALEPFRYLNENLQAMEDALGAGQPPASATPPTRTRTHAALMILIREFFRLAVVYPLLLLSFIAVAALIFHLKEILQAFSTVVAGGSQSLWAVIIVLRLLVLASLGGYFFSVVRFALRRSTPGYNRRFSPAAIAFALLLTALVVWIPAHYAHAFQPPNIAPVHHASLWLTQAHHVFRLGVFWLGHLLLLKLPFIPLVIPLIELAIAAGIRSFLINFLGDVAIYTNLNQRASYFATRARILDECGHAVTTLYNDLVADSIARMQAYSPARTPDGPGNSLDPGDFHLVIAAHSLGSVIAYDTINDLFNRARTASAAPGALSASSGAPLVPSAIEVCSRISGLLTFGSPLNKTYYFFRDRSGAEQILRTQIVDGLHSFRLLSPSQELAGAPLIPLPTPPAVDVLIRRFRWINVWAFLDPFSGKLFFYDLPDSHQVRRPYRMPFYAHLSYWDDPGMYSVFARQLL